jgi:hypothetical protein
MDGMIILWTLHGTKKSQTHHTHMCSIAIAGFEVAIAIAGSPPFLDKPNVLKPRLVVSPPDII